MRARTRVASIALGVLLLGMVFASPASAGTLSRFANQITFVASPGEANDLVITRESGGWEVRDNSGAPVAAVPPCMPTGNNEAVCPDEGVATLSISLGDRDDRATVVDPAPEIVHLNGGQGNDALTGSPGRDDLGGGSGDDVLAGRAGNDDLTGGSGDVDALSGTGRDRISGEEGTDQIRAGDGDDQADGGRDGDQVTGDAGADALDGGEGDDEVDVTCTTAPSGTGCDPQSGAVGDDTLRGGDGGDVLGARDGTDVAEGGAGRDTLLGRVTDAVDDSLVDQLNCGTGFDSARPGSGDRVKRDCERAAEVVSCPARAASTCTVRLRLTGTRPARSGRASAAALITLGSAVARIARGQTRVVGVGLNRPGRRLVRRRSVRVRRSIAVRDRRRSLRRRSLRFTFVR